MSFLDRLFGDDHQRAQRYTDRESASDRAARARRARRARDIAKHARKAEQWEQQDRRRFGGLR